MKFDLIAIAIAIFKHRFVAMGITRLKKNLRKRKLTGHGEMIITCRKIMSFPSIITRCTDMALSYASYQCLLLFEITTSIVQNLRCMYSNINLKINITYF